MSGYSYWRPVLVGVLLGGFIMLPRGDAMPATVDTVACANGRTDCRQLPPDGAAAGGLNQLAAPAVPAPVVPAPAVPAPAAPAPVVPAPAVPVPAPNTAAPSPIVPETIAPGTAIPVLPTPAGPTGSAGDGSDTPTLPSESDEGSETDSDDEADTDEEADSDDDSSARSGSSAGNPSSGGYSGTVAATTIPGAASCPSRADGASATAGGALVGTATRPAGVIDLASWYLTLPTGKAGDPDTVENPALASFANEFFKLNDTRDGVVFSARGDGVTTKNSKYPRSELREMNGGEMAAWSNTSGTHVLDVCEAITKLPGAKPEVVAAQIHDGSDDVMQIRLEGRTLMVQHHDGGSTVVMDPNYVLGTPYNVRIVAAGGRVDVYYNGTKKAELPTSGSGWYWKVGAYVQSNASKGDGANAVGEVVVYSLQHLHS